MVHNLHQLVERLHNAFDDIAVGYYANLKEDEDKLISHQRAFYLAEKHDKEVIENFNVYATAFMCGKEGGPLAVAALEFLKKLDGFTVEKFRNDLKADREDLKLAKGLKDKQLALLHDQINRIAQELHVGLSIKELESEEKEGIGYLLNPWQA